MTPPLLWRDDVVWNDHKDEHARLSQDWTLLRHAADIALWPFGSWREQTRTVAPDKGERAPLDVLIPQRRPLHPAASPLATEGDR